MNVSLGTTVELVAGVYDIQPGQKIRCKICSRYFSEEMDFEFHFIYCKRSRCFVCGAQTLDVLNHVMKHKKIDTVDLAFTISSTQENNSSSDNSLRPKWI